MAPQPLLKAFVPAVLLALLACLWLPASPALAQSDNPPAEPSSRAASAVDASAGGALETSLAVAVPAARGPSPSIGLAYSSATGNGIAGFGWVLTGFPAIVRARDTGMKFDATDQFVFLPGGWGTSENRDNRLVNAAGYYYRKKVRAGSPPEQFRPSNQSCGSGPCFWEMRDGSGRKYYFGGDANAHPGLYAPGTWHAGLWEPANGVTHNRGIVAWPLYKVVDADGNYFVVAYNQAAGTFRPLRVDYNLPLVGAQGRAKSVHFQYENRPDRTPMPSYHSVRLKNIRVYGHSIPPLAGTLIRRYELGYTISAASGRSLLTSFQEFGSNGNDASAVGLEATTFSYTSNPNASFVGTQATQPDDRPPELPLDLVPNCQPGSDLSGCLWNSFVGDLNADGKADMVRTYYGSYGGKVLYRCGGDDWLAKPPVEHSKYSGVQPTYLTAMGDFNGDGRQDLVAIYPDAGTLTTYIAYGAHANNTCALGPWILQPSQTVANVTMSSSPADWRILPADIDGDGMSDVVLFDRKNTVLYWKLYRDNQLSAILAGRYRSGEWTSCNADYPYPDTVGFNGIDLTDYNGDGKADIVASWSRMQMDGTPFAGMISMLTVLGTSSGLSPPSEECHTPSTPYGTPAVRYPYTAVRDGDINGDGSGDTLLTYQGWAIPGSNCEGGLCSGVVNGRDIRVRLGTTSRAGSNLQVYATDPDPYPYPSRDERPPHLNQWQFATADINGDGIDDYIQSYSGRQGDRLYYALGSPTGLGPIVGHIDDQGSLRADGGEIHYPKSTIAVGDFNGDGISDVARIQFRWGLLEHHLCASCREPKPAPLCSGFTHERWREQVVTCYTHVYLVDSTIFLGSSGGLIQWGITQTTFSPVGGDSRALDVLVADYNGDARDDLLFVNNNAEPPNPPNNRWIPNRQGGLSWLISSANPPDRLPDLLSGIYNGVLGTTTVTYRLTGDYPDYQNAVKPEWPDQCYGWNSSTQSVGYITGPVCGRVESRPRALVHSIVRNHGIARNGVTFKERIQYDYNNGRVYGGPREQRADLGFSSVTIKNLDTGAYTVRWYRQDKPFEGRLAAANLYDRDRTPLHRSRYVYFQGAPHPGVIAIHRSDSYSCSYEAELALPCAHRYVAHDPLYLVPAHSREGTNDIPGENDVYSYYRYHLDSANWLFRPRSSWTKRANASGTDIVLDMRRVTYDDDAGKTTHVLRRERILFDDAESASCTVIDDPWNVNACGEKVSSGDARWVTTFTTNSSSYDAQGNLAWFGSYPVSRDPPNPPWEHPVTLTYDAEYKGLLASTTNTLNQTTRLAYDAAGRLLTTTDPNNQTTTFGYDVYGRPTTYAPPGVGLYQKRWAYPGIDPVRGYQVDEFTYASPTESHQLSVYFDGFGGLAQTRDYSGLDGGTIDTLDQGLYISNQRARRESWPYFISGPIAKFIETISDPWGRPLTIKRVNNDASLSLDYHASGQPAIRRFSYNNPDGLHSVTTAINGNGSVRSVYRNYRGLVTKVVDDAGTTTFRYSTGLRLAQVTLPATTFNTVTYAYDSWGRLKTENDPNGEGLVGYTYDDAGMLTRKVYYRLSATTLNRPPAMTVTRQLFYAYDQLDRIVGERGLSLTNHITHTYDESSQTNGVGRLTTVSDSSGTTKFNYDGRGNVTSQTITLNGLSSVTYAFGYNDRNSVTSMTHPDSSQSFNYTVDGVLTAVSPSNTFAPWASWSDFNAFKQSRKYDTYWHYFMPRWANTTEYAYDTDQRISHIIQKQRDGTTIQDLSYTYDAIGNVRAIIDNRSTKVIGGVDTDLTQSFAYDPLNRLCATWSEAVTEPTCSTTVPPPAATFTYDGIGNLITDSGSTNVYFTTLSGERRIENKTGTTINWRAYHDTEGKRTRFEDCSFSPCVTHHYGYDFRGRLSSVTRDGVVRDAYEYDFADRRTKKSYNDLTNTTHSWLIGASYAERKSSSDMSLTAKSLSLGGVINRTYGDAINGQATAPMVTGHINQPFRGDINAGPPQGIYIRQPDLLGTPTLMTRTEDGVPVTRYKYDVWGALLAAGSVGLDTSYEKFTGHPREDFSGLAYYGFRYYHAKTRRFITPDDRIVGGGAQGYNRFAYVRNNPVSRIDPSGHQDVGVKVCNPPPCDPPGGGGGGGGEATSLGNPFDLFKELGRGRRGGRDDRNDRDEASRELERLGELIAPYEKAAYLVLKGYSYAKTTTAGTYSPLIERALHTLVGEEFVFANRAGIHVRGARLFAERLSPAAQRAAWFNPSLQQWLRQFSVTGNPNLVFRPAMWGSEKAVAWASKFPAAAAGSLILVTTAGQLQTIFQEVLLEVKELNRMLYDPNLDFFDLKPAPVLPISPSENVPPPPPTESPEYLYEVLSGERLQ
ncbi:RHS repeat-associated core domain-containing protein [Bradyrhizobium sp. sGM-13]|uniref:RHS repeat-associated core domain-containing protein n=1 Tax=Bradyrhizobium sp. sGM-13 TaxID=2831781 RepID=UPI001BCC9D47|nr:FG-GAP-like repeat-containing protein [Bradyrhizobium sp. sGM-13]